VLNRGIERRTIFPTRRCNERFIELLRSLPERFGVQVHAYALRPEPELSIPCAGCAPELARFVFQMSHLLNDKVG
jgi:hypothetical protein